MKLPSTIRRYAAIAAIVLLPETARQKLLLIIVAILIMFFATACHKNGIIREGKYAQLPHNSFVVKHGDRLHVGVVGKSITVINLKTGEVLHASGDTIKQTSKNEN